MFETLFMDDGLRFISCQGSPGSDATAWLFVCNRPRRFDAQLFSFFFSFLVCCRQWLRCWSAGGADRLPSPGTAGAACTGATATASLPLARLCLRTPPSAVVRSEPHAADVHAMPRAMRCDVMRCNATRTVGRPFSARWATPRAVRRALSVCAGRPRWMPASASAGNQQGSGLLSPSHLRRLSVCAFAQPLTRAMLRIAARHTARVRSALAPACIGVARTALAAHSSRCLSTSTTSTPSGSAVSSAASGHAAPARPAPMAPDTSRVHPNTKQASLQFARWLAQVRRQNNEIGDCSSAFRCRPVPLAYSC